MLCVFVHELRFCVIKIVKSVRPAGHNPIAAAKLRWSECRLSQGNTGTTYRGQS